MASYTAVVAKTQTLTATTVDTVTLTPSGMNGIRTLTVVNWDATEDLWFTWAAGGSAAATPTDGGDDCFPVIPGAATSVAIQVGRGTTLSVKLIGNANRYTVCVLPTV